VNASAERHSRVGRLHGGCVAGAHGLEGNETTLRH
jgi:hypothetical protein